MPFSVVIDTDLGNNIDDAFALSLAAVSPEIELLGVTTTWYRAAARALIARRLLGAWGRLDVPVSAGSHPRYATPHAQGDRYFTMEADARPVPPLAADSGRSALEWLEALLARERIVYVAMAALSNLAELLEAAPHLASRIERAVVLGGWSSQALPEWNIQQDPEGAAAVIRSGIPVTAIGYEVALSCILSDQDIASLRSASSPGARFLMRLFERWNRATEHATPVMYDPLTVAALIDPKLLEYETRPVSIQTSPGPAYGVMSVDAAHGTPVEVAVSVDRERFLRMLVERLTGSARLQGKRGPPGGGATRRRTRAFRAWTSSIRSFKTAIPAGSVRAPRRRFTPSRAS